MVGDELFREYEENEEMVVVGLAFFTPSADFDKENIDSLTKFGIQLNRFAAWWTVDWRCPEKNFSHVEMILDNGYSYSIKIGNNVSKTWRNYKDRDLYGFLNITVSKKKLQNMRKLCDKKVEEGDSFSYLSVFLNFVVPSCLRSHYCGYKGGVYRRKNETFCSKFVSEMLLSADILNSDVISDEISPNNLWVELIKWRDVSDNYDRVINTTKPAYSNVRDVAEYMMSKMVNDTSDDRMINLL